MSAVLHYSWTHFLAVRVLFAALIVAWKGYGVAGAGNTYIFLLWLCMLGFLVLILVPATKQVEVPTPAQAMLANVYRVAMIATLAWYGHPGLAALWVFNALAVAIHFKKYDANGMPLSAKAGSA